MDSWLDLPLFPLNTVLFPGMILPLHIFEERYKLMIGRCLEQERAFGVVLIREGKEVGGGAVPYDVGTTAVIAGASKLDDGGYNLVTVGSERFRLHRVRDEQSYLVGQAQPWPLAGGRPEELERRLPLVRALFDRYLGLLVRAQGHRIDIADIPDEPRAFALLVAVAIQVPMPQKQHLLSRPSISDLLRAEHLMLRREELLLDYMGRTQAEQWEGGHSGWLAVN